MKRGQRGFTILFAVLIASILLAIGIAIFDITIRELRLSSVARESQFAIYAAETGVECALYWDSKYGGSSSAFAGGEGAGSTQTIILGAVVGSLQTWTVPADWSSSNNTIHVIAGGGGGGGGSYGGGYTRGGAGGGGGGYSRISNLALTSGASVSYQVGAQGVGGGTTAGSVGYNGTAGGDSWFNGATYGASSAGAKGGAGGLEPYDFTGWGGGGAGGQASGGRGTVRYSGGSGGNTINDGSHQGGGGGGAAGSNGNGVSGTDASGFSGGYGGAGNAGSGGAGGGINTNGGNGAEFGTAGSGGGGGGGQAYYGGAAGLYGAGGGGGGANGGGSSSWPAGYGAQGIIIVTYEGAPVTAPTSGLTCDSHDIVAHGTPASPYDSNTSTWTPWSVSTVGATTTTQFTMPVASGNACSIVSVGKSINASGQVRTIVDSRGYNVGCGNLTDANATERALRVTF